MHASRGEQADVESSNTRPMQPRGGVVKKQNSVHVLLIGLHRFTKPVGLCRYTANLFTCLREVELLRVTLVLGSWQREYYREALQMDVQDPNILWVDLWRPSVSRYWWYVWRLPKLARQFNVDVVHALHQIPVVKRFFKNPIVLTIHDMYAYDTPEVLGYPNVYLNRLAIRSSLRASDQVVSISHFSRDRLCHWFPKLGTRMMLPVIYQEVRVAEPRPDPERVAATPPRMFLCVAQHRKNKNLDLLMESYFLGLDRGAIERSTQLVIVGSKGPETEYLKDLASRRSGVHFLDSISDEHLAYLYSSCEVFICASGIEGFCLPVAEALLFSCRVVCPNIPVLKEVAGERATYFELEPRSPDALLRAIVRSLASDEEFRAKAPLSTSDPAKEWVQLYQGVHDRSRRAYQC
jgi:glycosyltransferase involved in cell wall biosynthesis